MGFELVNAGGAIFIFDGFLGFVDKLQNLNEKFCF